MQTTIIKEIEREYLDDNKILDFVEFLFDKTQKDNSLELNIVFCDDDRIKSLNSKFRHKDLPTNILSFYGYDGDILGDIIISIETLEKEAEKNNKDIFDYLLFLLAHGFLHLLGYTHETMDKYNIMVDLQNKFVKEWKNEE